jgi:hypothetical protein
MGDVPPNQTVYVNNLNEKLKKEGESVRERQCGAAVGAAFADVRARTPAHAHPASARVEACRDGWLISRPQP